MDGNFVEDVVDYRGFLLSRSHSGWWTSMLFIIGVEIAELFSYYDVSAKFITYLRGPLHKHVAVAAAAVNMWSGVSMVLPFLGAFLSDSYGSRYRMISATSLPYILSLGLLTLSAMLSALCPPSCDYAVESCPYYCLVQLCGEDCYHRGLSELFQWLQRSDLLEKIMGYEGEDYGL